jgi:hypothetical protein
MENLITECVQMLVSMCGIGNKLDYADILQRISHEC